MRALLNKCALTIPQEYCLRHLCQKSHANPSLSRAPARLPLGIMYRGRVTSIIYYNFEWRGLDNTAYIRQIPVRRASIADNSVTAEHIKGAASRCRLHGQRDAAPLRALKKLFDCCPQKWRNQKKQRAAASRSCVSAMWNACAGGGFPPETAEGRAPGGVTEKIFVCFMQNRLLLVHAADII